MEKTYRFVAKSEEEAQKVIRNFKQHELERISDCYWYETWTNGEVDYELERDF